MSDHLETVSMYYGAAIIGIFLIALCMFSKKD
jgi:hypothetical protein